MSGFADGLDDFIKRVVALDGMHDVPLGELFSREFMQRHSSVSSFAELVEAGGYAVESVEDLGAIPGSDWVALVSRVTEFSGWKAMRERAAAEWAKRRLGLG